MSRAETPAASGRMKLGTRLFLLVLLSGLLPTLLLVLIGGWQLREQMRLWTIPSVETALDSSVRTNRQAMDRLRRELDIRGQALARVLPRDITASRAGIAQDPALLEDLCRQLGIEFAQIYVPDGETWRLQISRTPDAASDPDLSDRIPRPTGSAAGPERPDALQIEHPRGDLLVTPLYLWGPVTSDDPRAPTLQGVLAVGATVGQEYYAHLEQVSSGLLFYRRLQELGGVLRTGYMLLAGFVLALSLVFGLILATGVARGVSRPIESLVRSMDEVGRTPPPSDPGMPPGSSPAPPEIPELARLRDAFDSMRSTLRTYEGRLRETERLRGAQETARFVAHEIRNSLTPVRASLTILERQIRETPDEPRVRGEQALALIRTETDRMTALAGAYSEYARFPERQPTLCDLGSMVEDLARQEIPERIRLQVERDRSLPRVEADRDEMERLFRNLIRNAVEAIPGPGTIHLVLSAPSGGKELHVAIEDTGQGMDPGTLAQAFQPGFTTKETGTGLGLALVRRTLIYYGGGIRMESTPQKGTRCQVVLPAVPAEGVEAEDRDAQARPDRG